MTGLVEYLHWAAENAVDGWPPPLSPAVPALAQPSNRVRVVHDEPIGAARRFQAAADNVTGRMEFARFCSWLDTSPLGRRLRDRRDTPVLLGLWQATPALPAPLRCDDPSLTAAHKAVVGEMWDRTLLEISDQGLADWWDIPTRSTPDDLGIIVPDRSFPLRVAGCAYRAEPVPPGPIATTEVITSCGDVVERRPGREETVVPVYTGMMTLPVTRDWIEDYAPGAWFCPTRRVDCAPETEEQRQARVVGQEERDRARARSLMLLTEHLTDEQMAQWKEHEYFEVETRGKRRYRITKAAAYNVHRLNDEGRAIKEYCAVPQGHQWPIGDQLVMQLLLLKTDEAGFLAEANVRDADSWDDDD